MSVHFSPFVRQLQFDSWHERLHLQVRRVSTALGAGYRPVPGTRGPTDESCTRFRFSGSIPESEILF